MYRLTCDSLFCGSYTVEVVISLSRANIFSAHILHFDAGQFGFNQQSFINTGNFGGYQQPNPPSQMMGYQPPTYQSMFGTQANPSPAASQLSQPMTSQNKKGKLSEFFVAICLKLWLSCCGLMVWRMS